jgi:hypothetical protein
VYAEEYGDIWPLLFSQSGAIQRVYREYSRLVTLLDTKNGLIECCVADGCFTTAQADYIISQQSDGERNRVAIAILLRKSVDSFKRGMTSLIKSKQGHIVRLIAGEESKLITS